MIRRRRLGAEGPEVSVLGLGCNSVGLRIGVGETRAIVDAALESGINFLDTADVYGHSESETYLGEVLRGRRDDVVLATKWGLTMEGAPQRHSLFKAPRKRDVPRGSEKYVRWALEGSLRRLQTDRIDVYQYHRFDPETPLEETFRVLRVLIDEGKIRWVGLPPLEPTDLEAAVSVARRAGVPVVSVQHRYSLIRREPERELLPLCERLGLGLLPFYPLEGGVLTGKYRRDEPPPQDSRFNSMQGHWPQEEWLTDEAFDRVDELTRFAQDRGLSLLDVAIGGLAAMPGVGSVIAGATRPEQVLANARGAQWEPSDEDLAQLRGLSRSGRAAGA
jgi:aryl-alcohol dehydrogenase-like predicted oxidoreductase